MTAIDTITHNLLASARRIAQLPNENTAGFDDDCALEVHPDGKITIDVEPGEMRRFQHRDDWVTGRAAVFSLPNHLAVEDISEFVVEHVKLFRQLCEGMDTARDKNGNIVADYTREAQAAYDELTDLIDSVLGGQARANPRYTLEPATEFYEVRRELGKQDSPEAAVKLALEWAETSQENNRELVIDEDLIEKYARAAWHEYNPPEEEEEE